MRYKWKTIYVLLSILVAIVLVLTFVVSTQEKKIQKGSTDIDSGAVQETIRFEAVKKLSAGCTFLTYETNIRYTNPAKDNYFYLGPEVFSRWVPSQFMDIATNAHNDYFYLCRDDAILEFSDTIVLKRSISAKDFSTNGEEITLTGKVKASGRYLWFSANIFDPVDETQRQYILEWQLDASPKDRKIGPLCGLGVWDIDTANRIAYVPGKTTRAYDFRAMDYVKSYNVKSRQVDYDETAGLILSSIYADNNMPIVHINLQTGIENCIASGMAAKWGDDEWIYYSKGKSQLWRCQRTGENDMAVFASSKNMLLKYEGSPIIKISNNKRFLSYHHSKRHLFKRDKFAIVLVDLEHHEISKIPGEIAWTTGMGWLEQVPFHDRPIRKEEVELSLDRIGHKLQNCNANEQLEVIINAIEEDDIQENLFGYTPLHYAVQTGKREIVEALLNRSVEINVKDTDEGWPPLFWAVSGPFLYTHSLTAEQDQKIRVEIVTLLVASGANVNISDNAGESVLSRAKFLNFDEIVEILVKNGAKE